MQKSELQGCVLPMPKNEAFVYKMSIYNKYTFKNSTRFRSCFLEQINNINLQQSLYLHLFI